MDQKAKVVLSFSIITFSVGPILSHHFGSIFPYLPLSLFLSTSILFISLSNSGSNEWCVVLIATIIIGILYRFYIFHFPASMVGYDPGRYAALTKGVINTGHTDSITIPFYSDAPLFIILSTVFGILIDSSAKTALSIYPIIISIIYPLIALVLMKRIKPNRPNIIIATICVAATATNSFRYGFWPIGQTLAVVFWLVFVISLAILFKNREKRMLMVLIVSTFAAFFTHKLPLVVFLGLTTLLAIASKGAKVKLPNRTRPLAKLGSGIQSPYVILSILLVLLLSQWIYLTNFFEQYLIMRISDLFTSGIHEGFLDILLSLFTNSPTNENIENFKYASRVDQLYIVVMSIAYSILLFSLSVLAVLYYMYHGCKNQTFKLLIISSIFLIPLIALGYIKRSILNPRRIIFFSEIILILLSVGVLYQISKDFNCPSYIPKLFVIFLIGIQLFAIPAVPDYPETPRSYFTASELSSKEFAHEYTSGSVHTDTNFANVPHSNPEQYGSQNKYEPIHEGFFNKNVLNREHKYLLHREHMDVYASTEGFWKPTWDIKNGLDSEYNKPYDSGGAKLYYSNE